MSKPSLAVINSIGPAIERTKAMLFGPAVFGIWLRFGLLIFVEQLSRGGGSNFNFNFNRAGDLPDEFGDDIGEAVNETIDTALGFLQDYAVFIVIGLAIMLLIAVGLRYLTCRAEVMFARGCAAGTTSLTRDWHDTRSAGHSLFGFHLLLLALGIGVMILGGLFLYAAVLARHEFAAALPWLIALGVLVVFASIFFALADSLTRQFITPLMVHDNQGWRAAWAKAGPVLLANWLPLIGYYLLKICFWIVFGVVAMIAGCATLCIGFLPVVHQALFAPVYVFERNWSMVMLHYLGPGFEVFHAEEAEPEPISDAPWAPVRDETP